MRSMKQNLIPSVTSDAGLCLTLANWQEVKVHAASYSLEQLLYKPGKDCLTKIVDIKNYLAFPGVLVFNALSLTANKEGFYRLKSPYDGATITLTLLDILELIQQLKPNAVLLPKNIKYDPSLFGADWNHSIVPFFHVDAVDMHNRDSSYGIYFHVESTTLDWNQLEQWSFLPRYVVGSFKPQFIQELRHHGIDFIETDKPAQDALRGIVYSCSGTIDLADQNTRMTFEVIDAECLCPTCTQKLTQAYLHHLLMHTPLLCQRFLIQHNLFYVQNS